MPRRRRIGARLGALLIMAGGTGLVFLAILLMNGHSSPPKKEKHARSTVMEVKKEKKKPKQRRQRRQKPKPKASSAPRAPLPQISSSLSNADLGIPSLDIGALMGVSGSAVSSESVENIVMNEETVDVTPKPRSRRAPTYPPRARSKGIEGQVTLRVLIGRNGNVERVKVENSNPSGVFDDAAIEAVRGWQFEPALYRGERVRVWAKQVVNFKLG